MYYCLYKKFPFYSKDINDYYNIDNYKYNLNGNNELENTIIKMIMYNYEDRIKCMKIIVSNMIEKFLNTNYL